MYKYETHVHSKEGSACALSSAREMVQAYKKGGYAGLILTNHFVKGNTSIPKNLDWSTRMQMYYDTYLEAKEQGDMLDFDVLFGIEHHYGKGKEILIYGIDLQFLQSHPELETADIETYGKLVHDVGGILIHAHPYRDRDYIDPDFRPRYDVCDGIEVYNACDSHNANDNAMSDSEKLGMIPLSGGDIHIHTDERIGMAGVAFENRIKSIEEFVEAFLDGEGHIIVDGEIRD